MRARVSSGRLLVAAIVVAGALSAAGVCTIGEAGRTDEPAAVPHSPGCPQLLCPRQVMTPQRTFPRPRGDVPVAGRTEKDRWQPTRTGGRARGAVPGR